MISQKSTEKGHKKTIVDINKSEVKELLTILKKRLNTSASFRELDENKIEIKLNGYHDLREVIN